jgi:hypothetical protein
MSNLLCRTEESSAGVRALGCGLLKLRVDMRELIAAKYSLQLGITPEARFS